MGSSRSETNLSDDVKRILVSGDWHGYPEACTGAAKEAERKDCQVIVQCGDFGFWPHTDPGYVDIVNEAMKKRGLLLVWIDGNHENFDALFDGEWEKTPRGFWKIASNVLYAPRGLRWEWNDVTFLALGGAHSIDKMWRLSRGPIGKYWWPQETITQKNVYDALEGGPVDVMFSHDMPKGTDIGITLYKDHPEDDQNRLAVRVVVEGVIPLVLYHGHYHHRNTTLLEIDDQRPVRIESLADWKGFPLSSTWTVLDLDELKQER